MFRFLRVLTASTLALGLSILYDLDSETGTLWTNGSATDYVLILKGEDASLYSSEGEVFESSREEAEDIMQGVPPKVPEYIGQWM